MYCYVLFLYLKQLKIIHDELYHREEWISFRSISFQCRVNKNLNFYRRLQCRTPYASSHYNDNKWMDIPKSKTIFVFEYCCNSRIRRCQRSRLSSNPTHRIFESPLPNFPQINKNPITYHSKLHDRGLFKNSSRNSTVHRQRSWKIITGTLCHSIRVYTTLEKLLEH